MFRGPEVWAMEGNWFARALIYSCIHNSVALLKGDGHLRIDAWLEGRSYWECDPTHHALYLAPAFLVCCLPLYICCAISIISSGGQKTIY